MKSFDCIKLHTQTKLIKSIKIRVKSKLIHSVQFKIYPRFEKINLPNILNNSNSSLISILKKRKSTRCFLPNRGYPLNTLSKLLYYSSGIRTTNLTIGKHKRMYPSAGGLFPLEIYLINMKETSKFPRGIFHYNLKFHLLEKFPWSVSRSSMTQCLTENNKLVGKTANMFIVITAIFERISYKYEAVSYRFILQESGILLQNFTLVNEMLKSNSCIIGGFYDDKINKMLDLEQEKEQTVAMIALGYQQKLVS